MSKRITAVVENGLLKPLQPVGLPEGSRVELDVRPAQEAPEPGSRGESLAEALRALREEAAKYPPEWWDEFERDLQENRRNSAVRTTCR